MNSRSRPFIRLTLVLSPEEVRSIVHCLHVAVGVPTSKSECDVDIRSGIYQ